MEFSEAAVVAVLDQYAFPPDGPFPTGTVEFMEWLAFCEAAFGFEKQVITQPGQIPYLYGQVTPGQQELNFKVASACEQMAIDAGHFFPIAHTEEFGRRVFAAYVTVHECMVEHGYPVTDPPSEETFVAQWVAGGQRWHPYDATPFGGSLAVPPPDIEGGISAQASAQLELQATCPADWATVLGDFTPEGVGDSCAGDADSVPGVSGDPGSPATPRTPAASVSRKAGHRSDECGDLAYGDTTTRSRVSAPRSPHARLFAMDRHLRTHRTTTSSPKPNSGHRAFTTEKPGADGPASRRRRRRTKTAMRHRQSILTRAIVATRPNPDLRKDTTAVGPSETNGIRVTGRTGLVLWAVGLLIAVTACDSPDSGQPGEPLPTSSTSATVPSSTTSTSQPESGASTTADAIEQDVEAIIPTLEPPAGELIVEGSLEYFRWVGNCAEALGAIVAVTTSPPAIFAGEGPSNRRDGLVISACFDATYDQPWFVPYPFDGSAEARELEYELNLQIHQCLEENGYPTGEPPSKEAYVAGDEWRPYAAMGSGYPLYISPFLDNPPGSSQQLEAQRRCGASLAELYQQQVIEGDQP